MYPVISFLRRNWDNPVTIAFAVLVPWTMGVIGLSWWFGDYAPDFYENIRVEAHGVMFDLLVISLFVGLLNYFGEEWRKRQRYQEEINDHLGWEDAWVTCRIVGLIRLLNKVGVSKINLERAYLRGADLKDLDLRGANLAETQLELASLKKVNIDESTTINKKWRLVHHPD